MERKGKKKDNRGRTLKDGESQRNNGMYQYRYTDKSGTRQTIYSWRLVESDTVPKGRKIDISLREKEQEILRDQMDGIYTNEIKLSKMVERYMDIKSRNKKRVNGRTLYNYKTMLDKYVVNMPIAEKEIKDIKKSDITFLCADWEEMGLSDGTIIGLLGKLHSVFELAVDDNILRKNPCTGCSEVYVYCPRGKREALKEKEQTNFLDFLKNDKVYQKYYEIVLLALHTGLRRGELLGLTWSDIDFDENLIIIDHQLQYAMKNGKYQFEVSPPKTKAGTRKIPMSKLTRKILKDIMAKSYFENNIKINGTKGFIFLNRSKDKPLIPRQLSDSLVAATIKYNKEEERKAKDEQRKYTFLPKITTHILRHTACTRMAETGIDIKTLQYIMGHEKIDTTMDIYNHLTPNHLTNEAKKLENIRVTG